MRIDGAHDSTQLLECDPATQYWFEASVGQPLRSFNSSLDAQAAFVQREAARDAKAIRVGAKHWIRDYSPGARDCPSGVVAAHGVGSASPNRGTVLESACKKARRVVAGQCNVLGGWFSRTGEAAAARAIPINRELLDSMDELAIRGAIVWGFRSTDHTHHYIHQGIYNSFREALNSSAIPRHLCWLEPGELPPNCRLGELLNRHDASPTALDRSFVIASPKHMAWSDDPSLQLLPIDDTSWYVFHDTMPPHFEPIARRGRAIEWMVKGPDGNFALLDSLVYTRSSLSRLGVDAVNCTSDECSDIASRAFASMWAAPLTPRQISDWSCNRTALRLDVPIVHFVGSVWRGNVKEMMAFARGCRQAGVRLIRHGRRRAPSALRELLHEDDVRSVTDFERERMMSESTFTPVLQGAIHLNGEHSYVADRLLLGAAMGLHLATNNPIARQVIGAEHVTYAENVSELCALAVRERGGHAASRTALRMRVMRQHTYASRLVSLMRVLKATEAAPHIPVSFDDSQWCDPTDLAHNVSLRAATPTRCDGNVAAAACGDGGVERNATPAWLAGIARRWMRYYRARHHHAPTLSTRPLRRLKPQQCARSMLIVRHPFERLLSAYNDRCGALPS